MIYPISNHGLTHLQEMGVQSDRMATRYLGVLDGGLGPTPAEEIFTLVTCSGIDDNKRIHLLGEALSRLSKPARWIHFGDGPLREQALQSITSDRVIFECRGQTSNDDVLAFYAKEPVHCFVNLSIVEGLPVSVVEAISHGIPVDATAVYGVPEIVTNGYNGVKLPVQFTNEQIDEALTLFMTKTEHMATMRANARTRYDVLFNAEKNYNEFAKEIASLRL